MDTDAFMASLRARRTQNAEMRSTEVRLAPAIALRPVPQHQRLKLAAEQLFAIPAIIPEQHRKLWSDALSNVMRACKTPPLLDVTFVGQIGAGKSKLINVLLGKAVTKVGFSTVGTMHPTKILYHDEPTSLRAIEVFSEEELESEVRDLIRDADATDEEEDGKEVAAARDRLNRIFGKDIYNDTHRKRWNIQRLIRAAPFYQYLGKTIYYTQHGAEILPTGNAPTSNLTDLRQRHAVGRNQHVSVDEAKVSSLIKVEYQWHQCDLLRTLNLVDSPGLGDTDLARAAAAKRALAAASLICIVTPITRCDVGQITRELACLSQVYKTRTLDGTDSQMVVVCSKADTGLPNPELDGTVELDFLTPEASMQRDNYHLELRRLRQMQEGLAKDRMILEEFLTELGGTDDGNGGHQVLACQTTLNRLDKDVELNEKKIVECKLVMRNLFILSRNAYTKKSMRIALQTWLPRVDTSTVPIFTVSAERHEDMLVTKKDESYKGVEETEIVVLAHHLQDHANANLHRHADMLRASLLVTADGIQNFFSSCGQGTADYTKEVQNFFGAENRFQKELEDVLGNLLVNSFNEWEGDFYRATELACLRTKESIRMTPDSIFLDAMGDPIRRYMTMKATCLQGRRGVYVGIDFNAMIASIYLNHMEESWARVFVIIRSVLTGVTETILSEVRSRVAYLNALQIIGTEHLRKVIARVGETELASFQQTLTTAAYHAGAKMQAARQSLRSSLTEHIQERLGDTYDGIIVKAKGTGFVEKAKDIIVNALTHPSSDILSSCPPVLLDGLREYYREAWTMFKEAVETSSMSFQESYFNIGKKLDHTDQQQIDAQREFLRRANQILVDFGVKEDPTAMGVL